MKELTTEEKAKAYDEALEKAKMSYHTGDYDRDTLEMLEIIFPELKKEGYSEAVRKVIIKLVKEKKNQSGLKGYGGLGWEDILAWLENIPYTIDHEKREGFHLGYKACLERQGEHANFLSKIQVGDKVTRNEDGVLVNLSQLKRVAKSREKQCEQKFEIKTAEESLGIDSDTYNKIVDECIFGEQKPADKVEPKFKVGDKIYLKPEYRMPDDDTPIANTVKEIRRIDDKHYRFDGSYIFIEDQDKYELVEQKPEENKGNVGGISPNWSEEDEENFCSVYLDVKSARQNTVNSLSGELKEQEQKRMDEVISWLKSLRPQNHWKPSELQLGCLSDAIEYYNSSGYPAPKLKELLDDLKKLKEGKV